MGFNLRKGLFTAILMGSILAWTGAAVTFAQTAPGTDSGQPDGQAAPPSVQDLKSDHQDVVNARQKLKNDIQNGASADTIRQDRLALRKDRHDLRHDRRALRHERHEKHEGKDAETTEKNK